MAELVTRAGDEPEPLTAEQEVIARWVARRRVYLCVMFFFLVGAGAGIQQDPAVAKPFDWAYVGALVAGFGVILMGWRRSPGNIAFQQKLLVAMTALLLLVTVPLLMLAPFHTAEGALLFSAMLVLNRLF